MKKIALILGNIFRNSSGHPDNHPMGEKSPNLDTLIPSVRFMWSDQYREQWSGEF
jgi:hypothetical protein